MRTAPELRRKLREVQRRIKRSPTFWNVLVGQIYEECFEWALGDRRRAFWKGHPRLMAVKRRRVTW